MSTWTLGMLIIVTFTALAVFGLYATRRWVANIAGPPPGHNEGVDTYIAAASLLYGIVAGLIAVAAWEQFSNFDDRVTQEASSVATLYRNVSSYREPYGSALRNELRAYTLAVIEGWPQLQHGVIPPGPASLLNGFQTTLYGFEPKTEREKIIHASALSEFDRMVELRRMRLHDKNAGLPAPLWTVVILGGILTIFLTYFLGLERFKVHLTMTIICSVMVSLLIFMIAAVDHPFRGGVSIGSDAFQVTYYQLMSQHADSR